MWSIGLLLLLAAKARISDKKLSDKKLSDILGWNSLLQQDQLKSEVAPSQGVPTVTDKTTYSEDWAYFMADYAQIGYCTGSDITGDQSMVSDWTCGPCANHPNVLEATPFRNHKTQTNGAVIYDEDLSALVLTIAGTNLGKVKNILSDLDIILVDWGNANCTDDCHVSNGFLKAYNSVKEDIFDTLSTMSATYKTNTVYITGHSLGAAIALLVSTDVLDAGYEIGQFYTFGEPRVGNVAYADYVTGVVGSFHWRLTHDRDLVPQLPPTYLFYKHPGTEVWYTDWDDSTETGTYKVCDGSGEDNNCQDSLWFTTSVDDHLSYVGHVMDGDSC